MTRPAHVPVRPFVRLVAKIQQLALAIGRLGRARTYSPRRGKLAAEFH